MEFQFIDFRLDTIIVRKYLWLHECQGTPSWDAKCKKEVSFYHKNEKYSEKFRDSSLIIFFLWKANMRAYWITNAFLKSALLIQSQSKPCPVACLIRDEKLLVVCTGCFGSCIKHVTGCFVAILSDGNETSLLKWTRVFTIFFRGYSRLNVKCRWISL